ncbi:MAG: Lrp/AsnC family transcriptional regulator [Desulfobacterales bacterium]|jgi:Lrp/AsnC family leucine-responsive transcriptional regulator|nr:Lrp/AsnC family transcriptional regulator [Desulfobacterales bacterium]NOQ20398.1 AsnC family transcriptional regulator [Desulfobacterales bacterium]
MDLLDLKILKALQTSGRKKNAELARELGVAPSTMMERIRRLEESGVLQGYRASIDPKKMGLNIQAFISVTLSRHETEVIRQFEEGIRKTPHIRACYHLTGRFDYLLHVFVADLDQLGKLVKNRIAALPGFGKSETFLVFSEIKSDNGLPVPEDLLAEISATAPE